MDFTVTKKIPAEELFPLLEECLQRGQSVRFSPRGKSMLPLLRQGIDSVVLSPLTDKLEKLDIILYKRDNGKYIIHRITDIDETYTCIGDNQFKKESGIRREQIIAVVTAFYRNNKMHMINEPGYMLYCRFLTYSRPIRHLARKIIIRILKGMLNHRYPSSPD